MALCNQLIIVYVGREQVGWEFGLGSVVMLLSEVALFTLFEAVLNSTLQPSSIVVISHCSS